MASKLKSAAIADARTTAKIEEKKTPVKREDPIARAKRLLAEAEEKARVAAEKQMTNANQELDLAKRSLVKAARIYTERSERVVTLRERAGGEYGEEIPTIGELLHEYLPDMMYMPQDVVDGIDAAFAEIEAEAA